MEITHYSVLKEEVAQYLAPQRGDELIIDGTMGEGGHSEMFLSRFPHVHVIGLDADPNIQKVAKERLAGFGERVEFVHTWFNDYFMDYSGPRPDRILLDLGISTYHYEKSGRGFSFRHDEPLDMRLSEGLEQSAADLVNTLPEKELADLIYNFSDERYSRRIAHLLVERRKEQPFETTLDFAGVVKRAVPYNKALKIHPATRTFQALRIAVNSELMRLDSVLETAVKALAIGGRLGIITFHSLEDRAVKRYFMNLAKTCICPPEVPVCQCRGKALVKRITKKPIGPQDAETARNSASRSAKLRVIEKINEWE